ncbi:MAG TPA: efflux RND transporter permease subunit, partial [Chitinophagaceae bacterium]|nr:efflux RND transporter permease subunit [Chitinophagaceae bacterium]
SSSRFTQPNYWLDKNTGTAYQVQVEYPQYRINSSEELGLLPVNAAGSAPVFLRDVVSMQQVSSPGEYDRINQQRYITLTANIADRDLGTAIAEVKKQIASLGKLPQGIKVMLRGPADLLDQTMSELQTGLLIAIVVIFLLLTVNFQSFRLSLVVLSIVPAVIAGALLLLWATGQSLNIQSYMGTIMAVGVAVANAILLVTSGEQERKVQTKEGFAVSGAGNRMRPILMTSIAMIAGMIPMSIGFTEAGNQTVPLGIAVIGGLLFSTISTLLFLPIVYTKLLGKKLHHSPSLHPDDRDSSHDVVNG